MATTRIVLVQRTPPPAWASALTRAGYHVDRVTGAAPALGAGGPPPGLVVVGDVGGGVWPAIDAVAALRRRWQVPLVLIASNSSEAAAIAALRAGVSDYLAAPVTADIVLATIARLAPVPGPDGSGDARRLVGSSAAMQAAVAYASQVAVTNSTVLVTGETGTGKELVAELVHAASPRRSQPFVAFNCAAIPDTLLESELFGHERGAYTGADTTYQGKLKLADGGTVFFDEIGDLSPFGQAKLLRVLESRQVQRLGSAADIPLDIRVIAATNQDLRSLADCGRFRRDLYFRLSVTRLELPPLRERREDIPMLVDHFARGFAHERQQPFPGMSARALRRLADHDWPGNVRELRNVIEELFVQLPDRPIEPDELPTHLAGHGPRAPIAGEDERTRIVSALASTHWNKKLAAARLCWSRMTLYRKMAFHRIDPGGAADGLADTTPASDRVSQVTPT